MTTRRDGSGAVIALWCKNEFSSLETHGLGRSGCVLMIGSRDHNGIAPIVDPRPGPAENESSTTVEQLYRDTAPTLRRFFRNRVPDREDADDMVQEVFVRLTRDNGVTKLRNPAAWLQRVARNLLFDRARRSEVRHAAMRVPLEEAQLPVVAPDQMLDLEARDLLHRYEEALSTLSERTRQVFLIHRVEELSYREIAGQLGISVATVEYHMMRALAHLDRALGEE